VEHTTAIESAREEESKPERERDKEIKKEKERERKIFTTEAHRRVMEEESGGV